MPDIYYDDEALTQGERQHAARWSWINELGTDNKHRHHFVPQFVLRRWVGDDGLLDALDVEHLAGRRRASKSVAFGMDLYHANFELGGVDLGPEEALSKVENSAANAVRALIEQRPLDEPDRYDVALLLALQSMRVPNRIRELVPDDQGDPIRLAANWMLGRPDEPFDGANVSDSSSHAVAQRLLTGLDDFVGFERTFGFRNVFLAAHEIAARACRRSWTVLRFERQELVLGDDPVPWPPLGGVIARAAGKDQVWDSLIPVSPDTLLAISNRPGGVTHVLVEAEEADHVIAMSNEIQISKCIRHVFFPPTATSLKII